MANNGLSADIKRDAATTKTDMDKAREIVKRHGTFQGPGGHKRPTATQENIAIAIAEGVALGRKEGIAMALEAVARLKGENDASV
jgi:hypothetical protein